MSMVGGDNGRRVGRLLERSRTVMRPARSPVVTEIGALSGGWSAKLLERSRTVMRPALSTVVPEVLTLSGGWSVALPERSGTVMRPALSTVVPEISDIVGGLVGSTGGTIQNSYATGAVTGGAGSDNIGGLAGGSGGTITNSYHSGADMDAGDDFQRFRRGPHACPAAVPDRPECQLQWCGPPTPAGVRATGTLVSPPSCHRSSAPTGWSCRGSR